MELMTLDIGFQRVVVYDDGTDQGGEERVCSKAPPKQPT